MRRYLENDEFVDQCNLGRWTWNSENKKAKIKKPQPAGQKVWNVAKFLTLAMRRESARAIWIIFPIFKMWNRRVVNKGIRKWPVIIFKWNHILVYHQNWSLFKFSRNILRRNKKQFKLLRYKHGVRSLCWLVSNLSNVDDESEDESKLPLQEE